jgi:molecular chaperone GrpE
MKNPEPKQNHAAQTTCVSSSEEPEAVESRSETERLKDEIERLNYELRREHDMYVRNLADFDSYRRRVERERSQTVQAAKASKRELIMPLLEVMDDIEQALAHAHDDPQLPGVAIILQSIHRRLEGLLTVEGVKAFESLGQYFNPQLHEVVGAVKGERDEPGTVVEEVSRGWRWGDDLLRPARVKVAQ